MAIKLRGRVISGLGVGAKYVNIYRDVIRKYLGIDPYPGTLNIDVGFDASRILADLKTKILPPPRSGLGAVIVYKGIIFSSKRVYVLKPCITKHGWNVLEVIADENLRRKYGLKDGDYIEITIFGWNEE
jgi:riboflavin kinase